MTGYKVGDLSKIFSEGFSKPEEVPAERKDEKGKTKKSNKKALLNKGKQAQAQEIVIKDMAIQKAMKMKESIDKEKEKQSKKDSDPPKPKQSTPANQTKKKRAKSKQALLSNVDHSDEVKPKKVKKNIETKNDNSSGFCPPPGMVHESLLQKGKKRALDEKETSETDDYDQDSEDDGGGGGKVDAGPVRKKKKKMEDNNDADDDSDLTKRKRKKDYITHTPEEDRRTVFVGNLSLKAKERDLLRMFKEFGRIDSIRRRCVPVKEPDQLKRVAAIKQEYHSERNNCICYIKYKTEEAAKKALVNNGKLIDGLHIRVDLADGHSIKDTKRSVFVSNLPFDVEEEPVRAHFEDCGTIENVRLVRDRKTCLGKGIGYVKFSDQSSVFLALKLNGSSFQKRSLRVQRCQYNLPKPENSKSVKPAGAGTKKSKPPVKSGDPVSFQGEKAKKLKKKSKKSNARSSTSSLFNAKKTPTAVNKSFTGGQSSSTTSNKHVRFGDMNNKSGGKKFGKTDKIQFNRENNTVNKSKFSKKGTGQTGKQRGGFQKGKPDFKGGFQKRTDNSNKKHTRFD